MAQMPKYFDYVEVLEIDDENLSNLAKVRSRGREDMCAIWGHGNWEAANSKWRCETR